MDINLLKKSINSKTKAIIPVHLYGQMCNLESILKIAKKKNITVIEDCAQSQGAKFKKRYSGTFGKFGCFSFYPTKILGAYGDGGFILTNDYSAYTQIKRLRFYGIETVIKNKFLNEYYSNENGYNSRLDEIQCSILNYKLKKVNSFITKRRRLAKIYLKLLKNTSLTLPVENKNNKHVYHLFTVFHKKSRLIRSLLKKAGVETRVIYPYPIQEMKAYKKIIKNKTKLKNSVRLSRGIFCLPLYPELKVNEVKIICNKIRLILKKVS